MMPISKDPFALLREARNTLAMWADVAPAVSLIADIDAALAAHSPASGVGERDENGNLPCPFCGGECDPAGWLGGDGKRGPECEECGATAESTEVWNTRAALATQPLEQKPVAWANADELDNMLGDRTATVAGAQSGLRRVALYLGPQPEQVAQDADWFSRWIQNNYQDHATISGLCDAMVEAARSGGHE